MADNVGSEEGGGDGEGGKPSRASRVSTTGSRTDSSRRRTSGTGLYEPPSYEETQRKAIRVEKVARVGQHPRPPAHLFCHFHASAPMKSSSEVQLRFTRG
jgi:hypothetical protein